MVSHEQSREQKHTRFTTVFTGEIDRKARMGFLMAMLVVAGLCMIPFLVISFFSETSLGVLVFDVAVLGWVVMSLLLLKYDKEGLLTSVVAAGGAGALSTWMVLSGILGQGSEVWGVIFPFVAFAVLGGKLGLFTSAAYFSVIVVSLVHAGNWSYFEIFRFATAIVAVSVISYYYERSRQFTLTSLRRHAGSLYRSEKKYRRLFEESNDGIFLHTIDGALIDVNDAACKVVGYTRDTLLLMNIHELFGETQADMSWEAMEDTKRIGSRRFESSFKRADNRVVPVEVSSRVVDKKKGTIQTIVHDIAQRKLSEKREHEYAEHMRFLSESAVRFLEVASTDDQVYEVIGEGLAKLLPRAQIVLCEIQNSSNLFTVKCVYGIEKSVLGKAAEALGFDPVGKTIKGSGKHIPSLLSDRLVFLRRGLRELGQGAVPDQALSALHRLLRIEQVALMGLVHEGNLVGAVYIMLPRGKTLSNGEFVEAFIRQSSIALRRRALERELVKARETAEKANRTKGNFLANISHEVRTPMNAVIGMTNLALDQSGSSEQLAYLREAKHAAFSLLSILDDVLDFSRIESGRMRIEAVPFALREVLNHIRSMMYPRAAGKSLEFTVDVDPAVPDSLIGDSVRIRQVLVNLLSNAFKYTEKGRVALRVTAEPGNNGHDLTAVFEVEDTGMGIPEDHLESVFESFTQVDGSTTRAHGGAGLGLSICRELSQLMHGDLRVTSNVGEGSVFSFRVPLKPCSEQAITKTEKSGIVVSEELCRQIEGYQVLVAEDTDLNRLVVVKMLEKWGVKTIEACNGKEAVEKLQAHPVDMILMDVQMPQMDGFEATRKIRENDAIRVPIVALTAHAREEDRKKCLDAGMDDYLAKPVSPEELRDTIARWLLTRTSELDPVGPAPSS